MREAVYDGMFSTPKTAAGVRQIPLSEAAVQLTVDWRDCVKHTEPESLMFATGSGEPISRRQTRCLAGTPAEGGRPSGARASDREPKT